MNDPSPIGAWILERRGQPRWDHLQHHMLKPYARPVKHVQQIQVTQQKVALWVLWWNELSICYWCWIWIKVYDHKLQSMWSFFLYNMGFRDWELLNWVSFQVLLALTYLFQFARGTVFSFFFFFNTLNCYFLICILFKKFESKFQSNAKAELSPVHTIFIAKLNT